MNPTHPACTPGMEVYCAFLATKSAEEELLVAHHKDGSTREFLLGRGLEALSRAAYFLGYTLQPIAAPAAEPVPATVQAAE